MEEKKYPIGFYAPGNYQCKCCDCGGGFLGDKRAIQCEPCAVANKQKFDALTPEEQKELMKRNAEAIREVFKNWGKKPDTPLTQSRADFIREANSRDMGGVAEKAQFDNWHRWLAENGYTFDGEHYYDQDNNYFTPDQLWAKFK